MGVPPIDPSLTTARRRRSVLDQPHSSRQLPNRLKTRHHLLKSVTIYTDGACEGNPGPGGWSAILFWNGRTKEVSDGEPATTNNRMELQAAIGGLQALKEPCLIEI